MSLFLAFCLSTLAADATADESVAAAKAARAATIAAYREKLNVQKTELQAKRTEEMTACSEARTVWLGLQEPIASTNTELGLVPLSDTVPEIEAANVVYRTELIKLRDGCYTKNANEARSKAQGAGAGLVAVDNGLEKINLELKRLYEQEAEARRAARIAECQAKYKDGGGLVGSFSERCAESGGRTQLGSLYETDDLAGLLYPRSSPGRTVWLPKEFAACFPSEVEGGEKKTP